MDWNLTQEEENKRTTGILGWKGPGFLEDTALSQHLNQHC